MNQKDVFGIPPSASKANLICNVRIGLPPLNTAIVSIHRLNSHIRDDQARMDYGVEDLFVDIRGACRAPVDNSCLKRLTGDRHGLDRRSNYGLICSLKWRAKRHGYEDLITRFVSHESLIIRQWIQARDLQFILTMISWTPPRVTRC